MAGAQLAISLSLLSHSLYEPSLPNTLAPSEAGTHFMCTKAHAYHALFLLVCNSSSMCATLSTTHFNPPNHQVFLLTQEQEAYRRTACRRWAHALGGTGRVDEDKQGRDDKDLSCLDPTQGLFMPRLPQEPPEILEECACLLPP